MLMLLAAAIGVAAALYVVSAVGGPRPRSLMSEFFPELVVDEIEIDATTGLPIVPVSVANGPWWWMEAPDLALDASLRYASDAPASSAVDRTVLGVTLLAQFSDHAAARSVAEALAAAVGDPAAEAAWLVEAGQPDGGSFDWSGSAAATAPFVQVVDRWLLVGDLTYREPYDAWGTSPAGEPVYRSPLTLGLAQQADSLLVEGDRSGEGAVAFDAICRGAPDQLGPLSQDLADHGLGRRWQPPWIEPGITEEQRRARRTLRLVKQVQGAAFGRALLGEPEFERLDRALAAAADSGDADRIRAASDDLGAYIARALPDELPDLDPVAEALDPEIVAVEAARYARFAAELVAGESTPEAPRSEEDRLTDAQPFGASAAPVPWRSGDAYFEVSYQDDEISLWTGSWTGIAEGFSPLVDYLAKGGCADLDVVFHDFDDVRGD